VSILTESHLIKLLENKEHIVEIYEEIIEFNKNTGAIENYLVMIEQAKQDLNNIVKSWCDEELKY